MATFNKNLVNKSKFAEYLQTINKTKMYNYQQEKQNIFTENGQVMFMKIRDKVNSLLKEKKYFIMEEVLGCEGLLGK